ncbi:hypothetical protein JAAARDRAFT_60131 [Jaapia argillacea MUCL 33604]|uniref:BTB domain-containing protein n=1 Tax=Jaapia argillacea MUCL 33604 TaxID=933084 RepID=A0A067PXW2_9AGAM|nr:hypothetical protein JAAARDRAFT_60131 [Jaapia argillacea MUCL 33604]
MDGPAAESTAYHRHPIYYFEDKVGTVTLLVEDTLFKVHPYYLKRDSEVFRDMFSCPQEPGTASEGLSDDRPITIPQITAVDFEQLLWVYYHFAVEQKRSSTTEEWASILRLSNMYQISSIKDLAISRLKKRKNLSITLIQLGRENEAEELVQMGYLRVASRKHGLEPKEAETLGLAEAMNVMKFTLLTRSLEGSLASLKLDEEGIMDKSLSLVEAQDSQAWSQKRTPTTLRKLFEECHQYHQQKTKGPDSETDVTSLYQACS